MSSHRQDGWAAYTPDKRAARQEQIRAASFRRGINTLIGKIAERSAYLTDEQRSKLRQLSDAR